MKTFLAVAVVLSASSLCAQAPLETLLLLRPVAAAGYTYTATKFDGVNDWLTHSGDLSGVSDGQIFTLSFWIKLNNAGQDNTVRRVWRFGGDLFSVLFHDNTEGNHLQTFGQTGGGASTSFNILGSTAFTSSSAWHHIAIAIDHSDNAKRFIYVDGVAETLDVRAYDNGVNTDWSNGGDQGFLATTGGANITAASVSEVWFAIGQYVDISQASNLQKFRSVAGKPVSLGADGSTPTGSAPTLYFKNPFGTFQNNESSGVNDFSVTGTLEDDASIP